MCNIAYCLFSFERFIKCYTDWDKYATMNENIWYHVVFSQRRRAHQNGEIGQVVTLTRDYTRLLAERLHVASFSRPKPGFTESVLIFYRLLVMLMHLLLNNKFLILALQLFVINHISINDKISNETGILRWCKGRLAKVNRFLVSLCCFSNLLFNTPPPPKKISHVCVCFQNVHWGCCMEACQGETK